MTVCPTLFLIVQPLFPTFVIIRKEQFCSVLKKLNTKVKVKSAMLNSSLLAVSFPTQSDFLDFSQFSRIQFNCSVDYSNAENMVLNCVEYLTSKSLDITNINSGHAETFLLRWMNGTPDYSFSMNQTVCKIMESNISLLSIYIAFLAKYMIENKNKLKNENEICNEVTSSLLEYCKDYNIDMILNGLLGDMLKSGKKVA